MEAIKEDAKSEPKIRLLEIGSFFEKYPKDDNVEPELVWIYEEIGDIQSNAESKFIQTIKGKLSELTISGTEKSNRKQEVLKKRIAVLTDACRYLIKDSDSARAYGKMLKSEIDCLSDEEKSGEFLKDYEQFVKTIARKDPASKIKEIDSFLRGHPEEIYMSLGFPHVYEKLKKDKRRFEDERDWGNAKYDVEEFLKSEIKSKLR